MSYRQLLFLISCVSSLPLQFALPLDDYLHLLGIYANSYSYVSSWTHFVCYRNDENIQIALELPSIQSRLITNFDKNVNDLVSNRNGIGKHGFIVDMSCNGFETIFNQVQHQLLFNGNYLWVFLANIDELHLNLNEYLQTDTGKIMNQLDILPNSEVVLVCFDAHENKWTLYDVYKVAPNHPLKVSVLGWINEQNCCAQNGLRLNEEFEGKSKARKNLQGLRFRCASHVTEPVPLTYLDNSTGLDQTDIAAISTLPVSWLLRDDLNFSCDIVEVSNYEWNQSTLATDTMALYRENRIETLAHAENMRPEQLQYADFTADIFAISTPIIFRQPPLSAVSNIFILPLDKLVWYSYAALIFCVIFIMGFQMGHPLLEAQITLFDVVSFVTGAVAQQGTNFDIPSLSGRFVLITTFVATLALFTSYSASIVALLQSLSESIHTLDDLLASPLTLALKDTDTTREIFSSNESVLNRIRVKIEPMGKNAWIADEYNGISKVRADLFAFLVDAPSAYNAITRTYTESEKCRLSEIKVFPSPMNTITVAKYSAYKELIKQRILWMREVGLIFQTRVKWLPKKPMCEGDGRDFTSVGIREMYSLIYVYIFGTILSLAIFGVELYFDRCYKYFAKAKGRIFKTKMTESSRNTKA